jgi:hypothetical protein
MQDFIDISLGFYSSLGIVIIAPCTGTSQEFGICDYLHEQFVIFLGVDFATVPIDHLLKCSINYTLKVGADKKRRG